MLLPTSRTLSLQAFLKYDASLSTLMQSFCKSVCMHAHTSCIHACPMHPSNLQQIIYYDKTQPCVHAHDLVDCFAMMMYV